MCGDKGAAIAHIASAWSVAAGGGNVQYDPPRLRARACRRALRLTTCRRALA